MDVCCVFGTRWCLTPNGSNRNWFYKIIIYFFIQNDRDIRIEWEWIGVISTRCAIDPLKIRVAEFAWNDFSVLSFIFGREFSFFILILNIFIFRSLFSFSIGIILSLCVYFVCRVCVIEDKKSKQNKNIYSILIFSHL